MIVDKSESRVREMFREISPRYDLMNHVLSLGVDHYWRWQTVRAVPPNGSDPILDVCSGTGDLALAYWTKGGCERPVVGTDFVHQMLQRAAAKRDSEAQRRQATSGTLTFLEADTQHLPFADDCFQIVCVAFGLRNVTDTRLGLQEMVRVCKPGGRVAVLEFSMPSNRMLRTAYRTYFHRVLPRIGQLVARNRSSAYNYLPESVEEFPQGQRLVDLMGECGLEEARCKPLTFGIASLYYGMKTQ